jgi:hypothetical protein
MSRAQDSNKKMLYTHNNDFECNMMKREAKVWVMVFNATFNNITVISWRSVLLVKETGVPGENPGLSQVNDKFFT